MSSSDSDDSSNRKQKLRRKQSDKKLEDKIGQDRTLKVKETDDEQDDIVVETFGKTKKSDNSDSKLKDENKYAEDFQNIQEEKNREVINPIEDEVENENEKKDIVLELGKNGKNNINSSQERQSVSNPGEIYNQNDLFMKKNTNIPNISHNDQNFTAGNVTSNSMCEISGVGVPKREITKFDNNNQSSSIQKRNINDYSQDRELNRGGNFNFNQKNSNINEGIKSEKKNDGKYNYNSGSGKNSNPYKNSDNQMGGKSNLNIEEGFNSNENDNQGGLKNFNSNFRNNFSNRNRLGGLQNNRGGYRGNRRGGFNDRGEGYRNERGGNPDNFYRNERREYDKDYKDLSWNKGPRIDDYGFYKSNQTIIDEIVKVFKFLDPNTAIEAIKITREGPRITIFELLNELSRTNIINRNMRDARRNARFSDKISIMESHSRESVNSHEYMIRNFKTKELDQSDKTDYISQKDNYQDGRDRRRVLMKNSDGLYNYIPILCQEHKIGSSIDFNSDNCLFAHNDYEVNFHSLMYKTKICLIKNCDSGLCPNSHGLGEDFRKIYDYRDNDMINLTIKLEQCDLLKNFLVKFTEIMPTPTKFSLETFKTLPCRLGGMCDKDKHLCFNFHDEEERRRPPKLFDIMNDVCPNALPDKNSKFFPHLCPKGDHCDKVHTRYELLYQSENFRKVKPCLREKKGGRCKYFITCYGIHPEDMREGDNNNSVNLTNQINMEEILKNYVPLEEYQKNFKMFSCKGCGKIPENCRYGLTKCKHLLCENCLKKILLEKGEKCLICKATIEKGSLTKVAFSNN